MKEFLFKKQLALDSFNRIKDSIANCLVQANEVYVSFHLRDELTFEHSDIELEHGFAPNNVLKMVLIIIPE